MTFSQDDMPGTRQNMHRALLSLQEHVGETCKLCCRGTVLSSRTMCLYGQARSCCWSAAVSHPLHTYIAYADAGSDAEEAISDSEEEEVYDTSTDYDSEDEATTDSDARQSSAATAQQQVSLTHCCHCLNIVHIAGQRLSKKKL